MTPNRVKLGRAVMKYLARVVSLIFLAKTLVKPLVILFYEKMVVNEPMKSIYKEITNIPISV